MNAEAHKHRILCEEERFELERAQQKKGQADPAAELLREGQEALAKRDFARAVVAFKKTLELRKDDPEAARLLAQARAVRDKRETDLASCASAARRSLVAADSRPTARHCGTEISHPPLGLRHT